METPKGTKWLELTKEKALELWEKLNNIPGLWDDFTVNRPDLFFQQLSAPNSVWLERTDGNGILYLKNVVPGLSASGHVVYWDRRLRGREQETMDILRWLMKNVVLQKVNLFLPDYAGAARNFAERCGFKKEGCIRKWSYSQGKTFDVYVYGITIDEAFEQVMEEEYGPVHGTDSDEIRPAEQGVREPVSGLDQPATGDAESGHPDQPASSGEVES
jgi:hypothetical protein